MFVWVESCMLLQCISVSEKQLTQYGSVLEGTEDKGQSSARKLSSSDVTSEKVRKYSSVDGT